jgi:hypothetical protein
LATCQCTYLLYIQANASNSISAICYDLTACNGNIELYDFHAPDVEFLARKLKFLPAMYFQKHSEEFGRGQFHFNNVFFKLMTLFLWSMLNNIVIRQNMRRNNISGEIPREFSCEKQREKKSQVFFYRGKTSFNLAKNLSNSEPGSQCYV